MDKEQFLATLRRERQRWVELFREADPALLDRPGVQGEWSMVDVFAHVSAYERGLVVWLQAALRGEIAKFPLLDHPDLDHRNQLIYRENRGRSFEEVFQESETNFGELLALIEALFEEDLLNGQRTRWFVAPRWGSSRPLWECVADDSYRHYRQHLPELKAWLGAAAPDG